MMWGSFTICRRGLGRLLTALSYFFSSVFIPATGSMLAAKLVRAEITPESGPYRLARRRNNHQSRIG